MEPVFLSLKVLIWALIAFALLVTFGSFVFPIVSSYQLRRLLGLRAFGAARWARWRDLKARGMFARGGLFLGRLRWRDFFDNDEGHLITIAGTGGGKTSGLVVPALLEGKVGSFIVSDPSGELAAMTKRHRATIGPVALLSPWRRDFERDTGLDFSDAGFNPLSVIEDGPNLVDDARAFAQLLMVTDRVDRKSYWNEDAGRLIAGLIVWIKTTKQDEHHTLSFLHGLVYDADIKEHFKWMSSQKYNPYVAGIGDKFLGMLARAKPQFEGVVSKAQGALDPYAPNTPLGKHTSTNGLDLSSLKRERATVYLMVPSGRMRVAQPWLNLIVGLAGLEIGKPGPKRPITVLLDEFPALGYMPDLLGFLRQYRKAGLKMWLFSQTASAISSPDLYGRDGLEDIFGLCHIKQFFSVQEPELAQKISEWCGQRSTVNVSANKGGGSLGDVGQPLIRPDQVRGMKRGQQIIFVSEMTPPIFGRLVPYFKRRRWKKLVDPNPYRQRDER